MATSVHRVGHLLSAATACGNLVAVTSPDNKVTLYQRSGWQRIAELDGHEDTVTGLDFAAAAEGGGSGGEGASSGLRLVSSSHDRNAYVWTQQAQGGSEWQPEMVITRLTKAGLCVAWAPHGLKFAIGSSERSVDVVSLDAGRELWGPKLIRKKHDSSVMAVAWHPSAALLATAGTDSRLRLFNALVPGEWPVLFESSRVHRNPPVCGCKPGVERRIVPCSSAQTSPVLPALPMPCRGGWAAQAGGVGRQPVWRLPAGDPPAGRLGCCHCLLPRWRLPCGGQPGLPADAADRG